MQFGYYDNTNPVRDIDDSGYIRIAVIASFKNDGRFIPLKIQIEFENERNTYEVTVARTVESKDKITYHCYYYRQSIKYPIELIYLIKRHIWITPSPKA